MGRNSKPRVSKIKTVVQTVQSAISQTQGLEVGGSGKTTQQKKCWKFELQNVTPVGRNSTQGMPIRGVPDDSVIVVLSDEGTLGYAPKDKSNLMLKAIVNGSLLGEVLENQNNSNITVQLCLM